MFPMPKNWSVWPSVVPANTPTEMIIAPNEKAFQLFEGAEYNLKIISVNADENYYDPVTHQHVSAYAHDGVLKFTFTFSEEQEHLIILEYEEKTLQEFNVYSVNEDLYALSPLKGDFHAHSYRSDGKRDPSALAGHFREQGYDFFALTDHNRYYPGGEIDETFADAKTNLTHVPGEEVHTPGSVVHIVHVCGESGVCDRYLNESEAYEKEIAEYERRVPNHVPEQYKARYARAMWSTDHIHAAGGLAIFAHPFWKPAKSRVQNVPDEFAKLLLTSGMFDAYELIGGMGQIGNNRSVAMWSDLRAEGLKIAVVGSSDVHRLENSSTFPHCFTICFAQANDTAAIRAAVQVGNCVAVEATGTEYGRQYRCYGSLRLVTYAQFLLREFFTPQQRICQGEGVMMRAYANGEIGTETLELLTEQSALYSARFFGKMAPYLPSEETRAFENKWRETHCRGPLTKGSNIYADPPTRQI